MDRDRVVRSGGSAAWLAGGAAASILLAQDTARARAGNAAGGTASAVRSCRGAGRRHHSLLFCLSDRRIDSLPAVLSQPAFDFAVVRVLLGAHAAHLLDFGAHVEPADQPGHVCGAVAGVVDAPSSGCRDFFPDRVAGLQECSRLELDGCACWPRYWRLCNRTRCAENF